VIEAAAGSVGEVGSARSLPPAAYTSEPFYQFEQRAIFDRSWLFLCHVSQVPAPGDVHAVTVGDEPLLVTRDRSGEIHVLSAVCQHRGYVIAEADGPAKHLRCPYHFWTYGLDGRLLAAPSMGPAHDLEQLRTQIRLPELRTEVWEGMVFANFDSEATPLGDTLGKLTAEVLPYRMEDLVVVDAVTLPDLPFNWKNMQENALEEYHTTYIHKGYHENAPAHLVRHAPFEPGDGAVFRHAGLIIPGGEPVPGRPTFPVFPWLPDAYRRFFLFVAVPPTMFAAIRPDGIKLFRIVAHGPDRTTLTISFLFPPSTTEVPNFEALMARQIELIELIDQADLTSNTRIHRGLRSAFAPRGPYSPQETSLTQFSQWLLERYEAAASGEVPIS
jgi:phenylpropionate dioxygenase-like ring-hydroxylating dioxygenase large terminal subunit